MLRTERDKNMEVKIYKENKLIKALKCDEFYTSVKQGKPIIEMVTGNKVIEAIELTNDIKIEY